MSKVLIYDHQVVEEDLYAFWKNNDFFEPIASSKSSKNFSIILPPPNVTGHLHLGHAWDGALQDTMIRYKKLNGYRTIWIPGTDHAGIATQTKYEKVLKDTGANRQAMSDETFLKNLLQWSKEQAHYIHEQWAKLGFALSYKNEVYTLDKHVNNIVNKTFKTLYNQNLIYRDYKLVNWDVALKTAISDIEVVHRETVSKLYYFKYMIVGSKNFITVATTRPETMFGDVAVFVNPKDKKYQKSIGKFVINPINGEQLKIMVDSYVDMKFGTGAMKCTPAHDFNDYQLAIKHKITGYKSIINEDGTLNAEAKSIENSYAGVDRLIARDAIVGEMQQRNLLIKSEEHKNEVSYSERSGEVVEPLLSKQWFVKMAPLAKQTISLIHKQQPNFIPSRFKKTMDTWLVNVQDWCISRQLLWGHRIPVWYQKDKIVVGETPKNLNGWTQDKDVLDTWFSSGLWPTALTTQHNLNDFYPIDMLVTGYDILFFWVARMFFQCIHVTKKIPLKNVFFHGLIRDESNRKMSKSLNNGIDPMKVINDHGADALRMFLISTATVGEDLRYSEEKIKHRWSFINKVWNASNFLEQFKLNKIKPLVKKQLNPLNSWIIECYNRTIDKVTNNMDKYNFVVANKYLEDFIWEDYCNKYLEFIKPLLRNPKQQSETISVANTLFKNILVMLHPFAPFVTEKIYLKMYSDQKSIMLEKWPTLIKKTISPKTKMLMQGFNSIYSFIRDLRIKNGIKQSVKIETNLITNNKIKIDDINRLLEPFNVLVKKISSKRIDKKANLFVIDNQTIEYFDNFISAPEQLNKLEIEKNRLENEIKRSQTILQNKNFLAHAPREKVQEEEKKYVSYKEQYQKILENIKKIN